MVREQNRSQDPVVQAEPGEMTHCVSFPLIFLFLSLSPRICLRALQRSSVRQCGEDEDRRPMEYMLCARWMLVCSIRRGIRQREKERQRERERERERETKRKRVKEEKASSERDGIEGRNAERTEKRERERERGGGRERMRKGSAGPVRLVNGKTVRLSCNPSRKQSRILTLIYRLLPLCSTPLIIWTKPVAAAAPGSCSHPGEN